MHAKDPPNTIIYMIAKVKPRKRLIILGLMHASTKYTGVTNIDLSGERVLKTNLRK